MDTHLKHTHISFWKTDIEKMINMFNVKQQVSKKEISVGKFETILSQEEERKRWKLSRDLLLGCPNPTQDRQHFQILDENYMSTF